MLATEQIERPAPWPLGAEAQTLFLLDVRDDFEAKLLQAWVRERDAESVRAETAFHRISDGNDALSLALERNSERLWLQPLRIAWLPGRRSAGGASVRDFFYGRITQPGALRRRWLAKNRHDRLAHVAGEGAYLEDLRARQLQLAESGPNARPLSGFIVSQAMITLERAERVIRGARYKLPRLLPGDVFSNADFRKLLGNIAQQRDKPLVEVERDAKRYLREMGAGQTPFTLEIMIGLYRTACASNHDAEIDINETQLGEVAKLVATRPVVFLISHKSMLDTAALSLVMFDANLPLPLTFGGINLNTPGIGTLARRAGIIFLRRSFQDNAIYKATFRRYIDYLIEKRFSLLWALEGTRSRTGKLLPPRFGLFNYVVESILRTRSFEVEFVPVSVAYDQITEVDDYATEQRGHKKKPEGAAWLFRFMKRGTSRGKIHLRFGESLNLGELANPVDLAEGVGPDQKTTLVQTLAFEVAVRMNAATPITATAIVTLILLAGGSRALSLGEIQLLARAGTAKIRHRKLEIVGQSDFRDAEAVKATLHQLNETGVVSFFDEGTERLYAIKPEQHHNAAYYRNTAIHYFILDALVEIALLDAAALDIGDQREGFFARAAELRELLKFEFYFPRRANYRTEIETRAADHFRDWQSVVGRGSSAAAEMLGRSPPLLAHGVLRSFIDAYRVASAVLVEAGPAAIENDADFLANCLKFGKQRLLQGRVFSPESVSKTLYENGLKLARYKGIARRQSTGRSEPRCCRSSATLRRDLEQIRALTLASADRLVARSRARQSAQTLEARPLSTRRFTDRERSTCYNLPLCAKWPTRNRSLFEAPGRSGAALLPVDRAGA